MLGFIVSRPASLEADSTTLHLVRGALSLSHDVALIGSHDLDVAPDGRIGMRATLLSPSTLTDAASLADQLRRRRFPRSWLAPTDLRLAMLRAAPFDASLLTFAMLLQAQGCPVVNDPTGLLLVGHKAWLATLPDVACPATRVTRSVAMAHQLADELDGPVVLKPGRGSGGRGVSLVLRDDRAALDAAFEFARISGDGTVVIQSYVAGGDRGEKRLVWLDGTVLGGYLRTRTRGDFRHNLKCGGTASPTEVTLREHAIIAPLAPRLCAAGIRFAGIDLLGDQVLEVNALNPGGAYHADRLHQTNLANTIIYALAGHRPPSTSRRDSWALPVF